MPDSPFDEVAATAASGAAPLVIAVAKGLNTLLDLTQWLESAVPMFGARRLERLEAAELDRRLASEWHAEGVVFVSDAGMGDDATLRDRWQRWNAERERLLEMVRYGRSGSFVFPVTSAQVPAIAAVSPHLFSVASVLTVDATEEAAGEGDEEAQAAYRAVLTEMEKRYRLPTHELISRIFKREDLPVSGHDLARWQAAAEALRLGDR